MIDLLLFSVMVIGLVLPLAAPLQPMNDEPELAVDVTVTTNGGPGTLYGAFTYLAPTVSRVIGSFGPAAGGKKVPIIGLHLYGAIEVLFGANAATIVKMSDRSVWVTAPPGTGTVQVTVVTAAGTSLPGTHTTYTYR